MYELEYVPYICIINAGLDISTGSPAAGFGVPQLYGTILVVGPSPTTTSSAAVQQLPASLSSEVLLTPVPAVLLPPFLTAPG
mmetsp:Transcript_40295/g.89488  ORF Transcript_40295/g.89488 Transcript_40295/m.89488 type:complete len:82 (-) Transcript_40295:525-770(-)